MGDLGFQAYDVFVLVVLVGMTIFGGIKGLAWQVAQSASFLVSWKVAVSLSPSLAPLVRAEAPWNRLTAMLVLFVGTSLAIWLAFRFVSKVIERVQLKEFDRQMGAILGLINGVLLCMAVTFFAVMLSERSREMVLSSHSGFHTAQLIQRATPLLSEELRAILERYMTMFNEGIDAQRPIRPPASAVESPHGQPASEQPSANPGLSPPWSAPPTAEPAAPSTTPETESPPPSIWDVWNTRPSGSDASW